MASRFYFPSIGAAPAGLAPTITADWSHAPGTPPRRPLTVIGGLSPLANSVYTPDSTDHLVSGDAFNCQFISDPLPPQTFAAQTIRGQVQALEANANNNLFVAWKVYVVDAWTGTALATLVPFTRTSASEVPTSTAANKTFTATSSAYTASVPCRIVVELGLGGTPAATSGTQGHNGTMVFGETSTNGELPVNNTTTGSYTPWIEFANDVSKYLIQFKLASATVSSPTFAASLPAGIKAGSIMLVAGSFNIATGVTVTNDKSDAVTDSGLNLVSSAGGTKLSFVKAFLTPTVGAQSVTLTFAGGSPTSLDLFIYELANYNTFDKKPTASGTGTAADSGSTGTLTAADEFALGFGVCSTSYNAAGTGWVYGCASAAGGISEHRFVNATTALNATAGMAASYSWTMWAVTLQSIVTGTMAVIEGADTAVFTSPIPPGLVVGQTGSVGAGQTTSTTVALPNLPKTDNLVLLAITTSTISGQTVSAHDENNNSYSQISGSPVSTAGIGLASIFQLKAPANAGKTITITTSMSGDLNAWIAEFTGFETLERTASHTSGTTGTAINDPALVTTNDGDLLLSVALAGQTITSADAPWTGIGTVRNGNYAEFMLQEVHGSQAVAFSQNLTGTWVALAAAFQSKDLTGTLGVTEPADTVAAAGVIVLDPVTGTIAITEAVDSTASAGTVAWSATLTVTEGADVAAMAGLVGRSGSMAVTDAADTAALAGSAAWSASLATIEAADAVAAAALVGRSGSAAVTEAADTVGVAGAVAWSTALSIAEPADVAAFAGVVFIPITTAIAITEAADTATLAGLAGAIGPLAIGEGADGAAAGGSVAWWAAIAVTDQADVSAMAGGIVVSGAMAATEAHDVAVFAEGIVSQGSLAVTDAADVVVSGGAVAWLAALAAMEAADQTAFSGLCSALASLSVGEGADTAAMAGTAAWYATVSAGEPDDGVQAAGMVAWTASLGVTEPADITAMAGVPSVGGALALAEPSDVMSALGVITYPGGMIVREAPDLAAGHGLVGLLGAMATGERADGSYARGLLSLSAIVEAIEAGDIVLGAAKVQNPDFHFEIGGSPSHDIAIAGSPVAIAFAGRPPPPTEV